jgi:hypothetical protein
MDRSAILRKSFEDVIAFLPNIIQPFVEIGVHDSPPKLGWSHFTL